MPGKLKRVSWQLHIALWAKAQGFQLWKLVSKTKNSYSQTPTTHLPSVPQFFESAGNFTVQVLYSVVYIQKSKNIYVHKLYWYMTVYGSPVLSTKNDASYCIRSRNMELFCLVSRRSRNRPVRQALPFVAPESLILSSMKE